MATATESAPLVERGLPTIRFADDSIDLNVPEPDSPTSSFSGNSFNSYFPEFLRSHSFASDQDSDFDELDGLPDVEFPECHGFDVTDGENHAGNTELCHLNLTQKCISLWSLSPHKNVQSYTDSNLCLTYQGQI